jgi:hypothetical protein
MCIDFDTTTFKNFQIIYELNHSNYLKCYKTLQFVKKKILLINVHNFCEEN